MGYFIDDVGLISACADHDEDEEETDNDNDNADNAVSDTHPTLHPRYPTLIGEIGTPYDMDSKKSYGYTDNGKYMYDYTSQTKSLDASSPLHFHHHHHHHINISTTTTTPHRHATNESQ